MRSTPALALVLTLALLVGCGGDGDDDAAPAESTTIAADDPAGSDTAATPDTTASSSDTTAAPSQPEDGGTPTAWPAEVALPTAVEPTGAAIPDSLVETADPAPGPITLFTFVQDEGTASQSAFTGVGAWAETFAPFPGGSPCVKDDASAAALGGGTWACDALLPGGQLMQLSTSLVDGRMSLDVLIKEP